MFIQKSWLEFAEFMKKNYVTTVYIDSEEDDNVVYCCGNCGGEPIYETDYPEIDYNEATGAYICPICGDEFQ